MINEHAPVDIYVGRTPAPGKENNWVKSVTGRGWFPYVRMYGPGEDWFDEEAYALPQIEKTDW